ncbi:MAG TPA: glycosyltransferase family protein [Ignavibacteria bacterium]|nr:glycosyltransferase family protein [Ignavibacteria bacterium]HQY51153.1 glycosyltransferase family protein [Ignavibacteria bacterium]HRA99005.1 glycosyltransferase family protein [Ignavibacteria bacterium]
MIKDKKIVASIEARMTSSRLPGKVLMEINGKPVLEILIDRLKRSKYINEIVIATSSNDADDRIEELGKELNVAVFRGSEDDVLGRVVGAVETLKGDIIVEITGDCPLMDPEVMDSVIEEYIENYPEYDYVTNIGYVENEVREIPIGMDIRVFTFKDLKYISEITDDPEDREHVSLYFFRTGKNKYKLFNIKTPDKWKRNYSVRLALDTKEDFQFIEKIYTELNKINKEFGLEDILNFLDENKELLKINSEVIQKTVSNL